MIKNTLDIVNRARELADLQNSDFIGRNENIHLLNEAYTKLYTELINHKDRFFIKTLNIADLEKIGGAEAEVIYKLPEDFYMLCGISKGVNCEQILRKAPAESRNNFRYDIINNSLYLYGGVEQTELNIEYWPTPEVLTLSVADKEIELPEGYTWLDCTDNKYFGFKNGKLAVYNLKTNTVIKEVTFSDISNIEFLYSDFLTVGRYNVSGAYFYHKMDLDSGNTPLIDNALAFGKKDGRVYTLDATDEADLYYINNGYKNIKTVTIKNPSEKTFNYFCFDDNFNIHITDSDYNLYKVDSDGNMILIDEAIEEIESFNNKVYVISPVEIKTTEKILYERYTDYGNLIGINKVDNNTGYGVTVVNENKTYVKSMIFNTEIEFPNNFYYQYLSYMLAISYKAKQNADSTILQDLAVKESSQFYNAINQDVFQPVRINNVYNGGWN